MRKRTLWPAVCSKELLVLALLFSVATGCEGQGDEQPGLIVQTGDPRCIPVGGPYPSGLDSLPGIPHRAVVMQFSPKALLAFDLTTSPPTLVTRNASPPFPSDSDGDGVPDTLAFQAAGLCPSSNPACMADPKPGHVHAIRNDLVLVTTSDYEQVLLIEAETGKLRPMRVQNPLDSATHRASDWPLLPAAGVTAHRTALSSQTCVYPEGLHDSLGHAISSHPLCDPVRPSFMTRFTAASDHSNGLLFVATSNLASPSQSRFNPGSVLVFEFDAAESDPILKPHAERSLILTRDFNPTALTAFTTSSGRPLMLVTNTGSIAADGALLGDAGIDVIDVARLELVARYPLGRAGARGAVAVDPSGRVGLLGADSQRAVYAIDLSVLDDPALFERPGEEPVDLDGSTPNFPDGRIFWSEHPLHLPARPDGPPETLCATRTDVTWSHHGRTAYATDWCDGTINVLSIDWLPPIPSPFPSSRMGVLDRMDWSAPKTPRLYGQYTAPSSIRTHSTASSDSRDAPNLAFLLNEPEGQLCTARLEY